MSIPFWVKEIIVNLEHGQFTLAHFDGDLSFVRAELDAGRPVIGKRIMMTGPDVVLPDGAEIRNCEFFGSRFFGRGSFVLRFVADHDDKKGRPE